MRVSLQGAKPAISVRKRKKRKEHELMIAGGGGYEGPAALKNTPGGPAKCMDSIKKEKKRHV